MDKQIEKTNKKESNVFWGILTCIVIGVGFTVLNVLSAYNTDLAFRRGIEVGKATQSLACVEVMLSKEELKAQLNASNYR